MHRNTLTISMRDKYITDMALMLEWFKIPCFSDLLPTSRINFSAKKLSTEYEYDQHPFVIFYFNLVLISPINFSAKKLNTEVDHISTWLMHLIEIL